MSRIVHTDDAPAALGPYSQAVVHNGIAYCSGQVGLKPGTGAIVAGGVEAETRQALENLKAVLIAAGSGMEHALKVTVYLADMNDYVAVNTIYAEFFSAAKPARAAVEVARLPKDARVEIDCLAAVVGQ